MDRGRRKAMPIERAPETSPPSANGRPPSSLAHSSMAPIGIKARRHRKASRDEVNVHRACHCMNDGVHPGAAEADSAR
jgi:hypothetical protein